jgi:ectoine hydroxylase-related dioxygenase (phytanoyl-CoA dioxygenase family)
MIQTAQQRFAGKRDLQYHRMGVEDPSRLSREQIDSFNSDGYLSGIPIFEGEEITANRRYFDGLLAMVQAAGLDSYVINGWQHCCEGLYELCTNPLVVETVGDLLGPDVICMGAHAFCKLAHDPKQVSWHQDAAYWPLTPSKIVTAWLAIDDVDRENAALRVIPGSHLIGELTTELSENDENNVLTEKVPEAERLGDPVHLELKAGEISLHSDLMLHSSEANESDRRRCGIAIRYVSPDVRSLIEEWAPHSIWCRGGDPGGQWANVPRPVGDAIP